MWPLAKKAIIPRKWGFSRISKILKDYYPIEKFCIKWSASYSAFLLSMRTQGKASSRFAVWALYMAVGLQRTNWKIYILVLVKVTFVNCCTKSCRGFVEMTVAQNNRGCIFPIITIMKRISAVKLVFFLSPLTRWDWKLLNCFGWIYYKAKIGMHLRTEKSMAGEAGTFYICFKWTIWLEPQLRLFMHVKNIGQVKREDSLLIVHEELAP